MKIHIFGASGSGTTTLGQALAKKLGVAHFDSDDYYWKKPIRHLSKRIRSLNDRG